MIPDGLKKKKIQERELFPGQSRSGSCHHHPTEVSGTSLGGSIAGCRRPTTAADEEQPEPPASVLTRRRALVPPKIPPYNDSGEDTEQSVDKETSTRYWMECCLDVS